MLRLIIEQLIFLNKSLFNETIGWRYNIYILVSQPARYYTNRKRGYL